MATSDTWVNLAMKRFLSANRMKTNFLEYLQGSLFDVLAAIFPGQGLFTFPVTPSGNGVTGTVSVSPDPVVGTDGLGHILSLIGTDRCQNVPFPNEAGQRFWLGLKWAVAPENVYSNPRTGVPEYDLWREEVGELAAPTSVTDLGGTLQIVVDSLFTNGVDHTGRTVTVWLVDPVSADETVAFEELPVQYNAGTGENYITTFGVLGQGVVSTIASNYQVAAFGLTIRKSTLNPYGSGYLVLGWVEGGVVAVLPVSQDGQIDLSGGGGHTLQKAYDGLGGSGSGRDITISDQAVQIFSENLSARATDASNAALVLRKNIATSLWPSFLGEVGLDIPTTYTKTGGILIRVPVADQTGSDLLRIEEDVNLIAATNTVSFTRVGIDLNLTGIEAELINLTDIVEISGSTLGQNGLYYIFSHTANTVAAWELDRATPASFVAESGLKARICRPVVRIGEKDALINVALINDIMKDKGFDLARGLYFRVPNNAGSDSGVLTIEKDSEEKFTVSRSGLIEAFALNLSHQIRLGMNFLTPALSTDTPRIRTSIDPTTINYMGSFEISTLGVGQFRVYATDSALYITHNAFYQDATSRWYRDTSGSLGAPYDIATRYKFGYYGDVDVAVYSSAGANGWLDSAWITPGGSGSVIGGIRSEWWRDPNPSYELKSETHATDGIFRVVNPSTFTNPPKTTAPVVNALHAKNMPKAWGVIETDGVGGITLLDGFNVDTYTIVGTNIAIGFFFLTQMSNPLYGVNITSLEALLPALYRTLTAGYTATGFQINAINSTTGNILDPATEVLKFFFSVFGTQG